MARGDPQAKVDAFCNCVLRSLEKTMKRRVAAGVYFYSIEE